MNQGQILQQLTSIVDSLYAEQEERQKLHEFEKFNQQFAEVLETEPDLKDGKNKKPDKGSADRSVVLGGKKDNAKGGNITPRGPGQSVASIKFTKTYITNDKKKDKK